MGLTCVKIYSFFDMFKDKDINQYGYNPYETTSHFNAKGCDFIGKTLGRFILDNYNL